jgi:hypothetical protein
MENLARYIVRAFFYQERMVYASEDRRVVYRGKDGKKEKTFDALEWMAAICSHVPNKGEQMVRYYGFYSNVSRGRHENEDKAVPFILENEGSSREQRKSWARLIQKIYEVDPLNCPKCRGPMRVIAVIEDQEVTRKILNHLGLWKIESKPPPKIPKSKPVQTDRRHPQHHVPYSSLTHNDQNLYTYLH